MIKQHLQTSEPIYLEMWDEALRGIQKHLIVTTENSGLKIVAELPQGIGGEVLPKMDHLVCFLPGTIALAATGGLTLQEARKMDNWSAEKEKQITLARDLLKTCWGMYAVTETGLAPEITFFNVARASDGKRVKSSERLSSWKKDYIIKPLDAHNLQRPETVESLFMMWRITEDPIYRDWGWKIFQAFKEHTSVGDGKGYTSVNNVNAVPPAWRDNMESFWLVSAHVRTFALMTSQSESRAGRDFEIPLPPFLADRFLPIGRHCVQHRSSYLSSVPRGQMGDRMAAQLGCKLKKDLSRDQGGTVFDV